MPKVPAELPETSMEHTEPGADPAETAPEPALPAPRRARGWSGFSDRLGSVRAFFRQVYKKAEADNIFFMAGAISFNVLVAIVPLLLAAIGIAGTVLRLQSTDPTGPVIEYITKSLPPVSDAFIARIRGVLEELISQSAGFLGIGTLLLIWFSTRLIGTLRTVLRTIFDVEDDRGIIRGKLFDIKMVLAAGTLLAINVGLTLILDLIVESGIRFVGLSPEQIRIFQSLYGRALAFIVIWVMFFLIYRYLPPRRPEWRTALIASTFTAIFFEILKQLFAWWATSVANYSTTYGSLSTLVILFFWIYYSAIVFIMGGEIAQVAAVRRTRRRQMERLQ